MLRVFAKARAEDVLEPSADARLSGPPVERFEVATLPEVVFECIGFTRVRRSWNIFRKICHHDHSDSSTSSPMIA